MRKIVAGLAVLPLFLPSPSPAATQLGIRGGWSHATGDVFQGSGGIGGAGIYGFAASVGLLPLIDLEMAYERYAKDFHFDRAEFQDRLFSGDADYTNQAYLLTGKLHLPLIAMPFGLYGGGGFSLHRIDLDVQPEDESFADYARRLSDTRNEWEWHIVVGTQLKPPMIPILGYAEYRYQDVTGKFGPSYSSIYGGINLYLK